MTLEEQLAHVPDMPGVYVYRDAKDEIIYVGKAKSLRKRVYSYFGSHARLNTKTQLLVRQIRRLDVIVVQNEEEALLLENNLIKANQPRYNILLKDDKTYPWVCITAEEFPRIILTRRYDKKQGSYHGPYTHVDQLKRVLEELRLIVGYRTCKLPLTEDRIAAGNFNSCLEYHIHRCLAPCIGKVRAAEYQRAIHIVSQLLKGHVSEASQHIQSQIEKHAEQLEFEEAERLQLLLDGLKRYREKHTIINPALGNLDAMVLHLAGERGVIVYMQVREGQIVLSANREVKNPLLEEEDTVWQQGCDRILSEFETDAPLLITNVFSQQKPRNYKRVEIPQIGDKSKLVKMCLLNAKRHLITISTRIEKDPDTLLRQVQKDLSLSRLPRRIECIDNSNTQGTLPVSSCVVFVNGKPRKSEYRAYHIRTVHTPDDYSTMREVIERRYGKEQLENPPDLLVIDGGRGQLNIVMQTLRAIGRINMCPVVALAEKMEEIYIPNETYPLFLPKTSPTLRLMQHLRDEAHSGGVKAHSKRRNKAVSQSDLTQIPGIGPKTIQTLYQHYESLADIHAKGTDHLIQIVGRSKADKIMRWIENRQASQPRPQSDHQP